MGSFKYEEIVILGVFVRGNKNKKATLKCLKLEKS